jgi:hypothetical protein
MREAFIVHTFSATSLETIDLVNDVLTEYQKQGFRLSLRQLYYQLVARGYIENNLRSYKNLGNLISTARQAGLVDWEMIEDRNRETRIPGHWKDPAEIVDAAARQFRIDKWQEQPWYIEVMVEKDALSGVLEPVCRGLDVGITANKGYSSSSVMYEIGKRLSERFDAGKQVCIIYLGDHDPSGIDMGRDVDDRLRMYSQVSQIEIVRAALNYDQIKELHPPENPAKESDARYSAYIRKFGTSSWELDAVEPARLAELVTGVVVARRDPDLWEEALQKEEDMRDKLREFVDQYED